MNNVMNSPEGFWHKRRLAAMGTALVGAALAVASRATQAATSETLKQDDFVGISFWIISMALIASTAFFFLERDRVSAKWKTSLTVSGLVTLVAAVHYFYMREVWVTTGSTPTVFRYIDWLITVPLLMIEFYLILAAITKVQSGIFWRLIIGTLVMLIGGYLGEARYLSAWPAFIIGMAGWAFILYEIFFGQAGKISATDAPPSVRSAFNTMRLIVTFGWAIYPIGYYFGYLTGATAADSANALNIIYNAADVLNKIAFGLIIWSVAVSESEKTKA
ncbi:bacteriorhodopsin-like [Variovorax sp. PAMC 28711]|uniref:bacteriorhodopsin-like n=1 Tax=Variovorax sp. PAMC 28711 TaxID=1795631 RepID=UPI000AA42AF7|nr:bacteriorhodopsin-like [Variovorax sp. PAMC 28711]